MADSATSPTASPPTQEPDWPNLNGVWKLGKTLQAMAYGRQLRIPERNLALIQAKAGLTKEADPPMDEDMVLVDSTININQPAQATPPAGDAIPSIAPPPAPAPILATAGMTLGRAALLAAATGLGGGTLGAVVHSFFSRPAAPSVQAANPAAPVVPNWELHLR